MRAAMGRRFLSFTVSDLVACIVLVGPVSPILAPASPASLNAGSAKRLLN
jgi:hypothetical protein